MDPNGEAGQRVFVSLLFEVARGVYTPGEVLPMPVNLGRKYLLSPRVCEEALAELVKCGVLAEGRLVASEGRLRARQALAAAVRDDLAVLLQRLDAAGVDKKEQEAMVRDVLSHHSKGSFDGV